MNNPRYDTDRMNIIERKGLTIKLTKVKHGVIKQTHYKYV